MYVKTIIFYNFSWVTAIVAHTVLWDKNQT